MTKGRSGATDEFRTSNESPDDGEYTTPSKFWIWSENVWIWSARGAVQDVGGFERMLKMTDFDANLYVNDTDLSVLRTDSSLKCYVWYLYVAGVVEFKTRWPGHY